MPEERDTILRSSAHRILGYFLRHPQTADSPEGIARWRLSECGVSYGVAQTLETLDWLAGRGYLRKEERLGASPIFSLDAERIGEAESFIAAGDGETNPKRGDGR